ncbi:4-hydroxyphenylpyruvate dioxygenase [Egicoccus halophilus]|uniref:4-hydroxyphenylpyruvate dioxygenase n=1 Tax=Egicoccus halophilus TaxID=1670830 RepID=A0A8J3AAT4_9ACTN|nr:4-hydroxyphenylpyruvate dioxygenase [Egicoccus halophilus]GGI08881.1 4-hydroxyphenylpyruvate dioxygenase [Egicoccus halophilus]
MIDHDLPDLPLLGYDAIEFWVGNAKQAAHYYRSAFGFRVVAYAGPETGVRGHASYVLQQRAIRFVVTSGLSPDHEVTRHAHRHGDGIRDVAFRVTDAEDAFRIAVERGAEAHLEPTVEEDVHGKVVRASIRTYGDTIHSFVQRDDYSGIHLPGFEEVGHDPVARPVGLSSVDHVVGNVAAGEMDRWAGFYERILGFSQLRHFDDEDISTEYSALMSKVLWDGHGRIKMPINEPAEGRKRSQIEEFLDAYGGPGVQHLALSTGDIVGTVQTMRANGVSFLPVPAEYYTEARARVGDVDESWDDLAALGILVDRDEEGYLLQIFTEPVQDRPTVFYEIIQRHGSRGFGAGNFRALFEAIEREQARRGNL